MVFKPAWSRAVVIGLAAVLGSAAIAEEETPAGALYRYTNEQGSVVIDGHIPPKYSKRGYTILNPDGTVFKKVPRELTAEELRLRNTEESRRRFSEREKEQLRKWDESLLRRYSTVADIEAARERATRDLNIRINILKSNLLSVKGQIERDQSKAADMERSGRVVPAALVENIALLREEIDSTENAIAQRQSEIDRVKEDYQRDIDRFELLLDKVNLRRSQHRSAINDDSRD